MFSGCENLIADKSPSSVTQLPILTALHARLSTLFAHIIHDNMENVNTFLSITGNVFLKIGLDNQRLLC